MELEAAIASRPLRAGAAARCTARTYRPAGLRGLSLHPKAPFGSGLAGHIYPAAHRHSARPSSGPPELVEIPSAEVVDFAEGADGVDRRVLDGRGRSMHVGFSFEGEP